MFPPRKKEANGIGSAFVADDAISTRKKKKIQRRKKPNSRRTDKMLIREIGQIFCRDDDDDNDDAVLRSV